MTFIMRLWHTKIGDKMIDTLFFDFDGVICRTEKFYVDFKYQLFAEWGIPISYEALIGHVGQNFSQYFPEIYPNHPKQKEFIERFKKELSALKIPYSDLLNEEIFLLLKDCRQNSIRCGISSNSNTSRIQQQAKELGLKPYMEIFIGSDQTEFKKPDPRFYTEALKRARALKENTLVIEDSPTGIKAAKEAGMIVIAKETTGFPLDQSLADYRISRLDEAIDIIKKLNTCHKF